MASGSSSRHGGGGCGHYIFEEPPLARPPRIHFPNHVINLPKNDRSSGTIPNIVIFFSSYTLIIPKFTYIQCSVSTILDS